MTALPLLRCTRALALLLSSLASYAQTTPLIRYHATHAAMGTVYTIDLYASSEAAASQLAQDCFDEVDRVEALLSNYRPTSELSRISREASAGPVTTDPETFAFLTTAFTWSSSSGGAFDITVAPLMRTWGFFYNHGHVPSAADLHAAAGRVGWQHVLLDSATRSVTFAGHRPMELDPGGIGKGYAVDRVVALLRQNGVHAALISAGSSTIYALGAPPGATGWAVRVPDVENPAHTLSTVMLTDTSLSTSACTEKFFLRNGHRYCHILNPRSLRPVEGMLQTTIIAPSATDSDALSTATFVLKSRASTVLLQQLQQTSGLIVEGSIDRPEIHAIRWPAPLAASTITPTGKGPTP